MASLPTNGTLTASLDQAAADGVRRAPVGDGVRRYSNGANRQPPRSGLLDLDEVRPLDRALVDLDALAGALPRAQQRRDAATAAAAIRRLFAADRAAGTREDR